MHFFCVRTFYTTIARKISIWPQLKATSNEFRLCLHKLSGKTGAVIINNNIFEYGFYE